MSIGNGASAGRLVYVVQDGAGGGVQLTGTHAVRDGAWHHVAMVLDRDAGLLRGYVDGADDGSSALGGTGDIAPDVPIVIGNAFTGALDELAVHGEALGADAIGAIVAAGAAGRCDGEAFACECAGTGYEGPVCDDDVDECTATCLTEVAAYGPTVCGTYDTQSAYPMAVNDAGHMVGYVTRTNAVDCYPVWTAFLWTRAGGIVDLTPDLEDGAAYDVNDDDVAVGYGVVDGERRAMVWDATGARTEIPPLDAGETSFESVAEDVTSDGRVVGAYQAAGDATLRVFLWSQAEGVTEVGAVAVDLTQVAFNGDQLWVNEAGEVAAFFGTVLTFFEADGTAHALGVAGRGWGLSESGIVAGHRDVAGVKHGFLWSVAGGFVDVPPPTDGVESWIYDVNTAGDAVGGYKTAIGDYVSLYRKADGTVLYDVVPGWSSDLWEVNDAGEASAYLYRDAPDYEEATGVYSPEGGFRMAPPVAGLALEPGWPRALSGTGRLGVWAYDLVLAYPTSREASYLFGPCHDCGAWEACENAVGTHQCVALSACDPDPCENGGACADGGGGGVYTCDCAGTGFRGDRCEISDGCADSPCAHGVCVDDGAGGYTCDCAGSGFVGPTCAAEPGPVIVMVGDGIAARSADNGTTWTRNDPANGAMTGLAYASGALVAVGSGRASVSTDLG
ncbi:MAG: hypothetical protein KC635_05365, partial [Myxococcales bacterium]|nr:hypothetical protein [Myxococcales bacterium]